MQLESAIYVLAPEVVFAAAWSGFAACLIFCYAEAALKMHLTHTAAVYCACDQWNWTGFCRWNSCSSLLYWTFSSHTAGPTAGQSPWTLLVRDDPLTSELVYFDPAA